MATFGEYDMIVPIGRGGLAEVWRARAVTGGEEVALKILTLPANSPGARRIAEEWRLMSRLEHPNIVRAHGLVRHGAKVGLVMELCLGSLADVVRSRGPLPARHLCEVGRQVCEALAAAHAQGIAHRDVKPANLLVCAGDRIKLGDFGIAAALDAGDMTPGTESSALWGTLPFLAPERRHGARGDARSDQYALAMTLAWLGCGRVVGDLYVPAVAQTLRSELPADVAAVLGRAGSYAPDDRFVDMQALADALQAAGDGSEPVVFDLTPRPRAAHEDTFVPTLPEVRAAGSSGARWPILVASLSALLATASAVAVLLTLGRSGGADDRRSASTTSPALPADRETTDGSATSQMSARERIDALPACEDAVARRQVISRLGPRETVGALAADLDQDGWPDAVFTNQLDESLTIYWGGPDRLLEDPAHYPIARSNTAAAAIDLDGDGDLDLITNHLDDSSIALHRLGPERRFEEVARISQSPAARRLQVADWDGDGRVDLLLQLERGGDCTALRRGLKVPFEFAPHLCIGPPTTVIQPVDRSTPSVWRVDSDEGLVRHVPGPGKLMSSGVQVLEASLAKLIGRDVILAAADRNPGDEAYALAKAESHSTLLRIDLDGRTCRLDPASPLELLGQRAFADFNRDGLVDALAFATCSGCESNHRLLLGQAD